MGVYLLMGRQILYQVLFPIMSKIDDYAIRSKIFIELTHIVTLVFLMIISVILMFGEGIVLLLFGEYWLPAVLPFQIISVAIMLKAITANQGYYLYSHGKTIADFYSVTLAVFLLPPLAYWCTVRYGIVGTASSVLLVQLIVSAFAFEKFIKPLTDKGALFFLMWPMIIVLTTAIMSAALLSFEAPIFGQMIAIAAVYLCIYIIMRETINKTVRLMVMTFK